jgi:hypothetical protein
VLFPFAFEAEIERFAVGKSRLVWYDVLFLPDELRRQLPFDRYPRLRVDGEIAEVPFTGAFIPAGGGRNYAIVGPEVRKSAGVAAGDRVTMRFRVADQDEVEVPEALFNAVSSESAARRAWDALTPGKQRALSQHVLSAKTQDTRGKRVGEALDALVHFAADLRAWRAAQRRAGGR